VPADAKIAGRTWKYTKRDGTPDRRYRDNPQFPIVHYAHVLVRVGQYSLAILVTSLAVAEAFAAGFLAHGKDGESGLVASARIPRGTAQTCCRYDSDLGIIAAIATSATAASAAATATLNKTIAAD
jgi:hypothetical protein